MQNPRIQVFGFSINHFHTATPLVAFYSPHGGMHFYICLASNGQNDFACCFPDSGSQTLVSGRWPLERASELDA